MAKKQKQSKTRSLSWKNILLVAVIVLLVVAVVVQFWFNLFLLDRLKGHDVFDTRSLIVDSLNDMTGLKTKPDAHNRIQGNLQLPVASDSIGEVLYQPDTYDNPQFPTIQITSRNLINMGISQMNGTDIGELFGKVPEAQACNRGFTIRFTDSKENLPGDNLDLAGTKKLADGRTLYLWREKLCGNDSNPGSDGHMRFEAMNELQDYLLQAQSY